MVPASRFSARAAARLSRGERLIAGFAVFIIWLHLGWAAPASPPAGLADVRPAAPIVLPGVPWRDHSHDGRVKFLREMPATIRADHPSILPVAAAIRAVSKNPLEQIVMVNDVTHLLVDYDDDLRVYGQIEYHATLDEMIARRRQAGWLYLRDDCDGRAVFAAHLLASLGIPWRLEASYWKGHAWVVAKVHGIEYDLLDLRGKTPETSRWSYQLVGRWVTRASNPPPYFDWRRAWLARTRANVTIGMRLGMLAVDSTSRRLHERFSTDWMKVSPKDRGSPFDERLLAARYAAFPLGETLKPDAVMVAGLDPVASPAPAATSQEETPKEHVLAQSSGSPLRAPEAANPGN